MRPISIIVITLAWLNKSRQFNSPMQIPIFVRLLKYKVAGSPSLELLVLSIVQYWNKCMKVWNPPEQWWELVGWWHFLRLLLKLAYEICSHRLIKRVNNHVEASMIKEPGNILHRGSDFSPKICDMLQRELCNSSPAHFLFVTYLSLSQWKQKGQHVNNGWNLKFENSGSKCKAIGIQNEKQKESAFSKSSSHHPGIPSKACLVLGELDFKSMP